MKNTNKNKYAFPLAQKIAVFTFSALFVALTGFVLTSPQSSYYSAQLFECGNAICEPGEDARSCFVDCPSQCGNEIIEPGEECELDVDCGPRALCNECIFCEPFPFVCGNGILEPGEECDDGNLNNGDGCDEFCLFESQGGDD